MAQNGGQKRFMLSEVLKTFDGEQEVEAWISKFSLVAKLNNLRDEAKVLPLFLEGKALEVYLQMRENEQKDAEEIKRVLRQVFG